MSDWFAVACPAPSSEHAARAASRQASLTKPPGSLGALEEMAALLAALQSTDSPSADHAHVLVFAADHGVTARGVSAFPAEVTVQMLRNFVAGGAAISVLARSLCARLDVIDVGTAAAEPVEGVIADKSCRGTRDLSQEPAMTDAELRHALDAGRRAVHMALQNGPLNVLLLGEMGIGNTTAASALAAQLLSVGSSQVVGPGTGLDPDGVTHKARIIDEALKLHGEAISAADLPAWESLRRVGGLEIAALAGAMIASAQARVPILVDGLIVSAAALAADRIAPGLRPWLIFAHTSAEPGHALILQDFGETGLIDLRLRLGEASGAAVALPLLRAACRVHNEMATFGDADVSTGA